jgi:hypothetical protein
MDTLSRLVYFYIFSRCKNKNSCQICLHLILNLGCLYFVILIIHLRTFVWLCADGLSHVAEASVNLNDTRSLLELYKASQVSISEDDLILDSIGFWSGRILKEQLCSSATQRTPLLREVDS